MSLKRFLPQFEIDKFEYIEHVVNWLDFRHDPKAFLSPENMPEKKALIEEIIRGFVFNEYHNQVTDVLPYCYFDQDLHGDFGHYPHLEAMVEMMEEEEAYVQDILNRHSVEYIEVVTYADQLMLYSRCARYDIMDRIIYSRTHTPVNSGIDLQLAHHLLVYKYEIAWVLHELINLFEIEGMDSYRDHFRAFMIKNPNLDLKK